MEEYKEEIYKMWGDKNPVTFPFPDDNFISERKLNSVGYIKNHFPVNKEAKILDLGCSYGVFLATCKDLGYKNLFGVDVIDQCLKFAKDKFGLESVAKSEIFTYLESQADASFDVITAFDVIEHIPKDQVMKLLGLIYKKLKNGGVFMMQVPNGGSLGGLYILFSDLSHDWAYTDFLINEMFHLLGFSDISVECEYKGKMGIKRWLKERLRNIALSLMGVKNKYIFCTNIIGVGIKKI